MSVTRDFNRLTERAQVVASENALREALSLGHNYIGPEHLLLASARDVLTPADAEDIRNLVIRLISHRCPACGQQKPEDT